MVSPIAQHAPYYSNQLSKAAEFINTNTDGVSAKIENIAGNKTLTIKSENGVVLNRIAGNVVLEKMGEKGRNVDVKV